MTKPDLMAELAEVVREIEAFRCLPFDLRRSALYTDATHAALDFITTHHAELEAVVKDAARYRWLRDRANSAQGVAPMVLMVDKRCSPAFDQPGFGHKSMREGDYLDTAIDQAMHNSEG